MGDLQCKALLHYLKNLTQPELFCLYLVRCCVTPEATCPHWSCGLGLGEHSVPVSRALLGQNWLNIESRERSSPEIGFPLGLLFYASGHLDKTR